MRRSTHEKMEETILVLTADRVWRILAIAALLAASPAWAEKAYGPGASDTEIKLGQSTPLSGPASAFGAGAGRGVVGYFEMLTSREESTGARSTSRNSTMPTALPKRSNNRAGSSRTLVSSPRSAPSEPYRTSLYRSF